MRVIAKVAHIQPGTLVYRAEGDVFDHDGKIYKHVEKVVVEKQKPAAAEEDEESDTDVKLSTAV